MSGPLLEARQLAVDIGGKRVIDRLDLSLCGGERLAILGRNGAGKSTLLSTLAGLRPASAGAVMLSWRRLCADAAGASRPAPGLARPVSVRPLRLDRA